jgi:hypothetical protein
MKKFISENWFKLMIGSSILIVSIGFLKYTITRISDSNEMNFEDRDKVVSIEKRVGDLDEGGIIVKLNKDGGGVVIAQKDLGKMEWYDAVKACERLTLNGHTDWYLPSVEQFEMLYKLRDSISVLQLQSEEKDWFHSCTYWTSDVATDYYDHTHKIASYVRFKKEFYDVLQAEQRNKFYVLALRDF